MFPCRNISITGMLYYGPDLRDLMGKIVIVYTV